MPCYSLVRFPTSELSFKNHTSMHDFTCLACLLFWIGCHVDNLL